MLSRHSRSFAKLSNLKTSALCIFIWILIWISEFEAISWWWSVHSLHAVCLHKLDSPNYSWFSMKSSCVCANFAKFDFIKNVARARRPFEDCSRFRHPSALLCIRDRRLLSFWNLIKLQLFTWNDLKILDFSLIWINLLIVLN